MSKLCIAVLMILFILLIITDVLGLYFKFDRLLKLKHDDPDTDTDDEETSKEPRVLDDKETIRILNGYIKNLEKQLEEANENLELMQEQITGDTTELEYDHDIKILEEQLKQANERIEYLQKQINKNKNKTKIIYG